MKETTKEKIKLTIKEALLCLLDLHNTGLEIFDGYNYYRDSIKEYRKWRELDREQFSKTLYKLKRTDYIDDYKSNKNLQPDFKLSEKGRRKAIKYLLGSAKIKTPKLWDKKWRIVIFDVPEDKKNLREIVRANLKRIGFYQLQKSVFVYPFDCKELIDYLKYFYNANKYIQFIVAETIETELDLIKYFYDEGILVKN